MRVFEDTLRQTAERRGVTVIQLGWTAVIPRYQEAVRLD
jgi:hypothetical protein